MAASVTCMTAASGMSAMQVRPVMLCEDNHGTCLLYALHKQYHSGLFMSYMPFGIAQGSTSDSHFECPPDKSKDCLTASEFWISCCRA